MKIQLIMPMAGEARRFNNEGGEPVIKPLLAVHHKKLYQWALESLKGLELETIFLIRSHHVELKGELMKNHPGSIIVEIPKPTHGPGETLSYVLPVMRKDLPTLVCDCDLYFESRSFMQFLMNPAAEAMSGVLSFSSTNPAYSFISTVDDTITDIKEKVVISDRAVCGCYYFKSGEILEELLLEELKIPDRTREFYLSDLILASLKKGHSSRAFRCDVHVSLGTPEEIRRNQDLLLSRDT